MPILTLDGCLLESKKGGGGMLMDALNKKFALAGSLEELKAKGAS